MNYSKSILGKLIMASFFLLTLLLTKLNLAYLDILTCHIWAKANGLELRGPVKGLT